MGGYMKYLVFLVLPLMVHAQTPVLVESFTSPGFPPAGWDTTRSDSSMAYWVRYPTSGANPDSHHARVQVYNRYDSLRTGFSELVTRPFDLSNASGEETLSFWFRFSVTASNLGPDDSLSIAISGDSVTWDRLWVIGQSGQTNSWTIIEKSLSPYDHYVAARLRFRFEDRPNGSLGNTNRFFWLDSVKVMSYGVGVEETQSHRLEENVMLTVYPNPFRTTTTICAGHGSGCSELNIYDSAGRWVRSLILLTTYCLLPIAVWDGTDQTGQRLPSGVYACELRMDDRKERRMMTLIR